MPPKWRVLLRGGAKQTGRPVVSRPARPSEREVIMREMENDIRLWQRVFIDELFVTTCNLEGLTSEPVVALIAAGPTHRPPTKTTFRLKAAPRR